MAEGLAESKADIEAGVHDILRGEIRHLQGERDKD